jgi:hypothetical protein
MTNRKGSTGNIGINIGHTEQSLKVAREAILAIMAVSSDLADSGVKIEALRTLSALCAINHVTVSGCTVNS